MPLKLNALPTLPGVTGVGLFIQVPLLGYPAMSNALVPDVSSSGHQATMPDGGGTHLHLPAEPALKMAATSFVVSARLKISTSSTAISPDDTPSPPMSKLAVLAILGPTTTGILTGLPWATPSM